MHASEWIAVAGGVTLAAACGLRAFLPLLVLGLAARGGLVTLAPSAAWLAGDLALIALGVATVVELAADKIPVVDHVLDAVGFAIRPVAAWVATYALVQGWPAPWGQAAAMVMALMALGIQGVKAKVRLGSTVATLGMGNPIVSLLEDAAALIMSVAAVLVPLAALVLVVIAVVLLGRRVRSARGS